MFIKTKKMIVFLLVWDNEGEGILTNLISVESSSFKAIYKQGFTFGSPFTEFLD